MMRHLKLNQNSEAGVLIRALINKSGVYEYIWKWEIRSQASQDKLKLRAVFLRSVVLTLWQNWKLGNNSQPLFKHEITDPLNKRQTSPDTQHNKHTRGHTSEDTIYMTQRSFSDCPRLSPEQTVVVVWLLKLSENKWNSRQISQSTHRQSFLCEYQPLEPSKRSFYIFKTSVSNSATTTIMWIFSVNKH